MEMMRYMVIKLGPRHQAMIEKGSFTAGFEFDSSCWQWHMPWKVLVGKKSSTYYSYYEINIKVMK